MGFIPHYCTAKEVRKIARKLLPNSLKLQIKLWQRHFGERKNPFIYSKTFSQNLIGEFKTELKQAIRKGEFHENKIHNLKIVARKINYHIIQPNEVFSFWKTVGKPDLKNDFKRGRNLINNKISDDFGGGICQFSSIIYFLALQSGLKIIERHAHSIDIYKEDERVTPLGSDSTVAFGYKDLQIQNTFLFPIQLYAVVDEDELVLNLLSPEKIYLNKISFNYLNVEKGVWVETILNDDSLLKNFYIRL